MKTWIRSAFLLSHGGPQLEVYRMALRLISYETLRPKGITYSKPHLWRLEKANKFPKRVPIGAGRYGYVEEEIDAYITQKIADRDSRSVA